MKNFQIMGGIGYLLQSISFIVLAAQASSIFASFMSGAAPTATSVAMATPVPSPAYRQLPFLAATIMQLSSTALAGLAWIAAGRVKKNSVFIVTGVLGLVSLAFSVAIVAVPAGQFGGSAPPNQSIQSLLPAMITILAIVGVGATLGIAFFILEIVSLFSASKVFGVRHFRFAGFGMIASIVITVVAFIAAIISVFIQVASSLPSMPGAQPGRIPPEVLGRIFGTFSLVLWVIAVPFAISSILAAAAFFKIPTDAAPSPTGAVSSTQANQVRKVHGRRWAAGTSFRARKSVRRNRR